MTLTTAPSRLMTNSQIVKTCRYVKSGTEDGFVDPTTFVKPATLVPNFDAYTPHDDAREGDGTPADRARARFFVVSSDLYL